jgi:hypothetical protein
VKAQSLFGKVSCGQKEVIQQFSVSIKADNNEHVRPASVLKVDLPHFAAVE